MAGVDPQEKGGREHEGEARDQGGEAPSPREAAKRQVKKPPRKRWPATRRSSGPEVEGEKKEGGRVEGRRLRLGGERESPTMWGFQSGGSLPEAGGGENSPGQVLEREVAERPQDQRRGGRK